jgi:hypothetical protein
MMKGVFRRNEQSKLEQDFFYMSDGAGDELNTAKFLKLCGLARAFAFFSGTRI